MTLYNLNYGDLNIVNATLINIDAITTNYKNKLELVKKYAPQQKDNTNEKLSLLSNKKNKEEKILYLDDKKFLDIFTNNNKINEKEKYIELLKTSYLKLLKQNIYLIKKHPIYNMIKRSRKYGEEYDIKYLKDNDLTYLINTFYSDNNYKKYRNLYLILKYNNALDNYHRYSTDNIEIDPTKYYLYLKDITIKEDNNNFFKDKILVKEGTLESIDEFTINYDNIEELGLNSFNNNQKITLTGEGIIISDTTKAILERKLKKRPTYYEVLLKKDTEFYERMTNLDFIKKNHFNYLTSKYADFLIEDEEIYNEFINYYKKELDLSKEISDIELLMFYNMKTREVDYRMARYLYMKIKEAEERRMKKYRYERNRRLH